METVGRGYLARHGAREERYNELVAKAKSLPEHSSSWKATVADAARVLAEERRDSERTLKGLLKVVRAERRQQTVPMRGVLS